MDVVQLALWAQQMQILKTLMSTQFLNKKSSNNRWPVRNSERGNTTEVLVLLGVYLLLVLSAIFQCVQQPIFEGFCRNWSSGSLALQLTLLLVQSLLCIKAKDVWRRLIVAFCWAMLLAWVPIAYSFRHHIFAGLDVVSLTIFSFIVQPFVTLFILFRMPLWPDSDSE